MSTENETTGTVETMREIAARLNEAADAYYNGRGELMSDFEWDALFDRLKELEAESGVVLPESPTNKVSADDVAGRKEAHEFAALSLAKTKSVAEVAKWAEGRPVWLSWKLDGLTLVVTYEDGTLSKVVTRGDGHVGTNITHLASGIRGIPKSIPEKGRLVIRGEAVISYSDFKSFLASSEEDFANPLNLASGSLALKDTAELARRGLQWVPFTLVRSEKEIGSWGARMDYLQKLGLSAVDRELVEKPDAASIQAAIDRWTARVSDGSFDFPVDGLVFSYDDVAYASTGSVTGHHATRAGLAFKWADETASTSLERIEWSCAVASIAPVAVFAPVQLEGTTVRRASLCNISECERLGIGGPGTQLTVIKSNKIIPKVVGVTERKGELEIPSKCPVCGAPTEIRTSDAGTRTLRCTNATCAARELRKFMKFVSKDGLDIDGLAGETLAKFINKGWLSTPADVYRLGTHRGEIAALEGFGEKSADNIAQAVENARRRSAVKLLVALSIPLCGPDVAKRLLGKYKIRELFATGEAAARKDDLFSPGPEVFAGIDGIGPAKSAAFVEWCGDPKNMALVADLLGQMEIEEYETAKSGGTCEGLTFVITGDVHRFANRNAFKAYVESQGGRVAGSVSAKTSFLVNNDSTSTSGKNKKAGELGIAILTEDEFIERFGFPG